MAPHCTATSRISSSPGSRCRAEAGHGGDQVGCLEKVVQELVDMGLADARQQRPPFENVLIFQRQGYGNIQTPSAVTDQSNQLMRGSSLRTQSCHQDVCINDSFV